MLIIIHHSPDSVTWIKLLLLLLFFLDIKNAQHLLHEQMQKHFLHHRGVRMDRSFFLQTANMTGLQTGFTVAQAWTPVSKTGGQSIGSGSL